MRLTDVFPLPFKDVSDETKLNLEASLRRSNSLLKQHHGRVRSKGFLGNRRAFFSAVCGGESYGIPSSDLEVIRGAKALEGEFLAIYSRLILKRSGFWSGRLDGRVSAEDICSVATLSFLKAFCCFTREGVRFSTYLTHCVDRGLMNFISSHGNQLGIPLEIMKIRFKVRKKMREEGLSLDVALEKMGVSGREGSMVAMSMYEVRNVEPEGIAREDHESEVSAKEVLSVVGGGLSGLERVVFDEFMLSGEGMNLSEISRKTINPKTGRPYSKMAVSYAWKKIRGMISVHYGKVA